MTEVEIVVNTFFPVGSKHVSNNLLARFKSSMSDLKDEGRR